MKKADIDIDALQKMEQLKEENERLKELLEESKRAKSKRAKSKRADDSWDFKWDGRGSYEESRRCFYGDFS